MIDATFKFKETPTSEAMNNLLRGVLKKGITTGGAILPGPGLSIRIEPFVARSLDLTVREQEWTTLKVNHGLNYICLEAIHYPTSQTDPRWLVFNYEEYLKYPNIDKVVLFGIVNVPKNEYVVSIDHIDCALADKLIIGDSDIITTGEGKYNGPSGVIYDHFLGHTQYNVHITTTEVPVTGVGDIWVAKEKNRFIVYNSGTPGYSFDWTLVNKKNRQNSTIPNKIKNMRLMGKTQEFIYPHQLNTINHITFAIPTNSIPGEAGNIWFDCGINQDVIHNDGIQVPAIIGSFPLKNNVIFGNGRIGTEFSRIQHKINSLDYFVAISFTDNPCGSWWVEKENDYFEVFCSELVEADFKYVIFTDPKMFTSGWNTMATSSMTLQHDLNSDNYIPIITPLSTDLGHYSIIPGRNTMTILSEKYDNVTFEWMVLN